MGRDIEEKVIQETFVMEKKGIDKCNGYPYSCAKENGKEHNPVFISHVLRPPQEACLIKTTNLWFIQV